MTEILIIDSDQTFNHIASSWLKNIGYDVKSESNLHEGLKSLTTLQWELVFIDKDMIETVEFQDFLKERINGSVTYKIVITGIMLYQEDIPKYLHEYGAFDCIEKRIKIKGAFLGEQKLKERVLGTVFKAIGPANKEILLGENFKREKIIGNSPAIIKNLFDLSKAAKAEEPILIKGETGAGKQLFAEAVHKNSLRFKKKFFSINCGALPEEMLVSELFGYKKGSHNTAFKDKEGLIKKADGGTLFLDEIGNLSLSNQKRLLTTIEQKMFYPMGATVEEYSDFRLVSATNANIDEMVKEGSFREDFLNRISTFVIELSPLRERVEDIKDLAQHFIETHPVVSKRQLKLTPEFIRALEMYKWEGNVREFKNAINQSIADASDNELLEIKHLPQKIYRLWIEKGEKYRGAQLTLKEAGYSLAVLFEEANNFKKLEKDKCSNYQIDSDTGISKDSVHLSAKPLKSVFSPMSNNNTLDITPEDIITGRIKWQQILKLTSYYKRVSIMVVARSLWSHPQKDLAAKLGVESNTLEKFFSTAKKKAKMHEFQIDDLKPFVSNQHHNALQSFFNKI